MKWNGNIYFCKMSVEKQVATKSIPLKKDQKKKKWKNGIAEIKRKRTSKVKMKSEKVDELLFINDRIVILFHGDFYFDFWWPNLHYKTLLSKGSSFCLEISVCFKQIKAYFQTHFTLTHLNRNFISTKFAVLRQKRDRKMPKRKKINVTFVLNEI